MIMGERENGSILQWFWLLDCLRMLVKELILNAKTL